MVVKRQCSFCANEIEPGTGTMFIKRDGTVFHFCSSSCRKQQLHLGRVGHRLKWTRAHALKRAADQSSALASRAARAAAAERPAVPSKAERKRRPATESPAPTPTDGADAPATAVTKPTPRPRAKKPAKPPPTAES
ncbi:MAG: 50S ribosomal protein L24e [Thermoplasmata archaeon]